MSALTTKKAALVAVAIAVAGGGAYWHYSPYLAIGSMQKAAKAKDADAFNDYVDYPKLRENLKGQMAALMAERMAEAPASSSGFEALGSALALALINPMIDAMARPEVVMAAMARAEVSVQSPVPAEPAEPRKEPKWEYERKGANKLVAFATDPEETDETQVGVVFERSGFADWKLTELRLPSLAN